MPKAPLFDVKGNRLGEVELPDAVFGIEPNEYAVHEAVTLQAPAGPGMVRAGLRCGAAAAWCSGLPRGSTAIRCRRRSAG